MKRLWKSLVLLAAAPLFLGTPVVVVRRNAGR
jgi:hypothetical protein